MDNNQGGGKWHHVGKVAKTKVQQQEAFDKMPKIQDLGFHTSLLYDDTSVGDGEPLRDTSNMHNQQTGQKPPSKQVNSSKKKSKKPASEAKYAHKTIEAALTAENSLEKTLLQIKENFSDKPALWPKEVSGQLNVALRCPEENGMLLDKPFDYPLCLTRKSLNDVLMKLFGEDLSDALIPLMFDHCFNVMLDCITRDTPSWGYRLCIQALAHSHPRVCLEELEKYEKRLKSIENVPKKCSAFLWALGQTGVNSSKRGMEVWLQVMLPHLGVKQVSQFAMPYVETILSRCKKPTEVLKGTVTAEQYWEIAKWTHDKKLAETTKHMAAVQQKMRAVYPTIRSLATDTKERKRKIFTYFLKLSALESSELSDEVTAVTLDCLKTEPSCFQLWREKYTNSFYRSRLLLREISERWQNVALKMSPKDLKETVLAFHNTNSEAAARSTALASRPEFREIRQLCESINSRLTEKRSKSTPFWRIIIVASLIALLALGVGHVYFDYDSHGGVWERTDTYAFLEAKGVVALSKRARARAEHFYDAASSWLKTNVPLFWNATREVLGPYVSELGKTLSGLLKWLNEASSPIRAWLLERTAELAAQVFAALKVVALHFLEVVDTWVDITYNLAVWMVQLITLIYEALLQVVSGEVGLAEIQDGARKYAMTSYTFFSSVIQQLGNYIAPDNP